MMSCYKSESVFQKITLGGRDFSVVYEDREAKPIVKNAILRDLEAIEELGSGHCVLTNLYGAEYLQLAFGPSKKMCSPAYLRVHGNRILVPSGMTDTYAMRVGLTGKSGDFEATLEHDIESINRFLGSEESVTEGELAENFYFQGDWSEARKLDVANKYLGGRVVYNGILMNISRLRPRPTSGETNLLYGVLVGFSSPIAGDERVRFLARDDGRWKIFVSR
jgi:hypothetical protein